MPSRKLDWAIRYSGAVVTERMTRRGAKKQTDQEIIEELKRVAAELDSTTFTSKKFDAIAIFHSATWFVTLALGQLP